MDGTPTLARSMSTEQAFVRIAAHCLGQMRAQEQGAAQGNIEALHQMRVGLRRLRAALSLFKPLLCAPPALLAELDWLAQSLAPARDWDVLAWSTLAQVARATGDIAPAVRGAAFEHAAHAHAALTDVLASARYAALVKALAAWLQDAGWRKGLPGTQLAHLDAGIVPFARAALKRNARRLARREACPEALHRLRIAAKKSRYGLEFFATLFAGQKRARQQTALAHLQDKLGQRNDIAVAQGLLAELGAQDPALAVEAAYVRGFLASRAVSAPGGRSPLQG